MELEASIESTKVFRLFQLDPGLLASLEEGSLTLKSDEPRKRVVLCTRDTTHAVRMLKQSNSLLMAAPSSRGTLKVFASPFEMFEVSKTHANVDWSTFPEYRGARAQHNSAQAASPTAGDQAEWACSPAEFEVECRRLPAITLHSQIMRISPRVTHDVAVDIVSSMVEKGDLALESSLATLRLQTEEPAEVVQAVYNKFEVDGRLDADALSAWIGAYILKSYPDGVQAADFVREWTLDLPYRANTDTKLLRDCAIEPRPGWIQYLSVDQLSQDPRARFDDLFAIKPEWHLEAIAPFIEPLLPPSQKLESWILKFARKRRIGAQTIITPMR